MKKLLLLAIVSACATTPKVGVVTPIIVDTKPSTVNREKVLAIVANSPKCTQYRWKERGIVPIGYIKGVSLIFAKHACTPNAVTKSITGPIVNKTKDVFGYYPKQTMRDLFTLLLSSGAWESSGRYYVGRDMSANFDSANSAEAGLFQTSWGLHGVDPLIDPMLKDYKDDCLLDVFKEGAGVASSGNLKNWGDPSSDGYKYQQKSKLCPAFHTDVTLIGMRKNAREWGPLRSSKLEFKEECSKMFQDIESSCQ